ETQQLEHLGRIGKARLSRQQLYPPDNGIEMQVRETGSPRFRPKAFKRLMCAIQAAQSFNQAKEFINRKIGTADDFPVTRLRKIALNDSIGHSIKGLLGDTPRIQQHRVLVLTALEWKNIHPIVIRPHQRELK